MNKVDQADLFVVLDCVQFSKKAFQHRNRVIGVDEQPSWLTIPLATSNHQQCRLPDMRINNTISWQDRYKNILYERYHRHPAWADHHVFIESIWTHQFDRLIDLNMHIIRYLLNALGITTPLILASALGPEGTNSELNLDICRKVGARTYLAGPLSRNYLDEESFGRAGIAVRYHAFCHPSYQQYGRKTFSSHLSALDLLMNHGEQSLAIIQEGTA